MRRLPTVLIGALTLSVGLLPAAAFADSTPPPTPTPSASATVEPPVATTPAATATPTPTGEPTATVTPSPSTTSTAEPTDPGGIDYLEGTFIRTPASGPVGTTVKVVSKTSCVDAEGTVGNQLEFVMLSEANLSEVNGKPPVDKIIKTDTGGAWKTTVEIPASAKVGDVYFMIAACFPSDVTIDESAEPFLIYDFQEFTVTGADKAPVADPVPGDPNFAG